MSLSPAALTARLLLVLALVQLSQQALGADTNSEDQYPLYEDPVRDSASDEVKNLPGLNDPINFRQFSGYLRADSRKTKFLHYWFVESQSNPSQDPLVLWLNGGPGCSSLGGLFTELGPFLVNDDGKTLRMNEFSWNKMANVIFLESPPGVGFSYSTSLLNVNTDDTTAEANHYALRSFLEKFPQYKNRSLYLAGESYAGVYLPTLGVLVDADDQFNLKGIAIGNGLLDMQKLHDSVIFFAYHHGLVGKSSWDEISKRCCNGQAPSRKSCKFDLSFGCGAAVASVVSSIYGSGINPYNLYGRCLSASQTKRLRSGSEQQGAMKSNNKLFSSKEIVDRAMIRMIYNSTILEEERPFFMFEPAQDQQHQQHQLYSNHAQANLGLPVPCVDDHTLVKYLAREDVRAAIHIPKKVGAWDLCSMLIYVSKYAKAPGGLTPQMKQLIESKRNLAMLVYNGDVDTVCNFLGDEWFVDELGRKVVKDYSNWKVNNQIAGYVKHYDGITFATIRGSGHMVPGDRPQEAFEMFKIFLNAKNHTILL